MIRLFTLFALAAALAAPAFPADRAARTERSQALFERATRPAEFTRDVRSLVRAAAAQRKSAQNRSAAAVKQAVLPMAPGVTQINLFDSGREAYFVLTEVLPAGSTVQAYVVLPNDNELALEARNVVEDLPVGYSFILPGIKTLGDFWQTGLTTYYVVVTKPSGDQTMSATDFATKGYFRDLADTSFMVPGINWYRQFTQDGAAYVEIRGRFLTGVKTYVVFEDIVAPPEAIKVIDPSTIQVNLNLVPNFDTTLMKGYLLTVGQDSWTDTYPFRYTPLG